MWLLNCSSYRLESKDPDTSRYWILSHTWGDDEVTFQDMQNLNLASRQKGFQKIKAMCELASANGQSHVWIDTCCIDKTSSAELSEAINSMFYWYERAVWCVAYLEDLEPGPDTLATEEELRKCRWFTRGWTLQELLAPSDVEFYDRGWNARGTKRVLSETLCNITKIGKDVLVPPSGSNSDSIQDRLQMVPAAAKMSWAAGRQTTRIEDKAYCLLGIFDVHMPLLYGERHQAFTRLQQAIAQNGNDMSLFAWIASANHVPPQSEASSTHSGLLASDPSQFAACAGVVPIRDPLLPSPSWIINNAALEMTTALDHSARTDWEHTVITRPFNDNLITTCGVSSSYTFCFRLFLYCRIEGEFNQRCQDTMGLAIWLRKTSTGYVRFQPRELCLVTRPAMVFKDPELIRIATSLTKRQIRNAEESFRIHSAIDSKAPCTPDNTLYVQLDSNREFLRWRERTGTEITCHPPHLWDRGRLTLNDSRLDTPSSDNLNGIGLIRIPMWRYDDNIPPQTCWVFCGLISGEQTGPGNASPWVEFVCQDTQDSGGSLLIFGRHFPARTELTNPFILSSVIAELRELGVRPDPEPRPSCFMRSNAGFNLRLSAEFAVQNTGFHARAHGITIRIAAEPDNGPPPA